MWSKQYRAGLRQSYLIPFSCQFLVSDLFVAKTSKEFLSDLHVRTRVQEHNRRCALAVTLVSRMISSEKEPVLVWELYEADASISTSSLS